jgi:ferredoxin-NADP reductase
MAIRGVNSVSPATDRRIRWQQAKITAIVSQSQRIKSFFFAPSEPFAFRAGQHVDVRLTAPDGYQAQRSYSIASAPESDGKFELAIERLEDGEVSPFFHDAAEVGDDIELRGPIGGHFIWSASEEGPILLLGGGSGVVPLVSMVRHRAARGSTIPMLLLYSARTWKELAFRDELMTLDAAGDGFQFFVALTREAGRRAKDFSRRIDAQLASELLASLPALPGRVFVCGSNPFVEAATRSVIEAGINPAIVRTERYGG